MTAPIEEFKAQALARWQAWRAAPANAEGDQVNDAISEFALTIANGVHERRLQQIAATSEIWNRREIGGTADDTVRGAVRHSLTFVLSDYLMETAAREG